MPLKDVKPPLYEFKEHGIISHPGVDGPFNFNLFSESLRISIVNDKDSLEFDLINVDCSFANALRRVLIAEVPSVAIDRVYLLQNTSVIPDEVFCHRLGLVPLAVDPSKLTFPSDPWPETDDISKFNPSEHLIFDFNAHFTKAEAKSSQPPKSKSTGTDLNVSVKSRSMYR